MIIRRSRLIVVVALLIVLHLLFILYICDVDVHDISDHFGASDIITNGLDVIKSFTSLKKLVTSQFNEQYLIPYQEYRLDDAQDKEYMYYLDLQNHEDKNSILIPSIYKQESKAPPVINYDPRLTLGLILNHLKDTLQEDGGSGNSDLNSLEIPFFHWSDYANLSSLNEHILNPSKRSCESFRVTTGNQIVDKNSEILYPENFCADDDVIDTLIKEDNSGMSPSIKRKLSVIQTKKDSMGSTGFHIHRYPGRSSKEFKILEAKSYLNDFMDPPFAIVLLLPTEPNKYGGPEQLSSALKININQNPNGFKKLVHSNMFTRYYEGQGIKTEDEQDVNINVKEILDQFLVTLGTNKQYKEGLVKNSNIPYEKTLTHELFVNNGTEILEQYNKQPDQVLSPQEQNYKEGLDLAINSPYPLKYFYEAKMLKKEPNWAFGGHYDWRFFNGIVNSSKLQPSILSQIISSWFKLVNNYHLNTWIAHGSLLSWYWNALSFPWDVDVDVQMPIQDLHALCKQFNQTVVFDLGYENNNEIRFTRGFLDCGSYIGTRQNGNGNNNIDARFIDMDTGLYIDITGLALTDLANPIKYNIELPKELSRSANDATVSNKMRNEYLQIYNCKNNHFTKLKDLSPLRLSKFEGQYNYVPNNFKQLLVNEYKIDSINKRKFKIHSFIKKLNLWVSSKDIIGYIKKKRPESKNELKVYRSSNLAGRRNPNRVIDEQLKTDEDYVDYLFTDKEMLFEYLLTNELTGFHDLEMEKLTNEKSTKSLLYKSGKLTERNRNLRHDYFNLRAYLTGYNFKVDNDRLMEQVEYYKKFQGIPPEEAGSQAPPEAQAQTQPAPEAQPNVAPIEPAVATPVAAPQAPAVPPQNKPQVQAQADSLAEAPMPEDAPDGVQLPKLKPGEMSSAPGLVKQGIKHLGDTGLTRPNQDPNS